VSGLSEAGEDLPDAGDLVWIDFNHQSSHEQTGHRPALVLSPRRYHEKASLAVVCPITSNTAPYPFKVMLPEGLPIEGAVLADQVRSVDRKARKLRIAGSVSTIVIMEVKAKLASLVGLTL
jgi:mRNA interferase MazF